MQTPLSINDILIYLSLGIALGGVYFFLLWQTIQLLPRVKRQGLFLFISGALRIFLLIFISLIFAGENVAHFLLIFAGVILMRLVLLKTVSTSIKQKISGAEVVHSKTIAKPNKKPKKSKGKSK